MDVKYVGRQLSVNLEIEDVEIRRYILILHACFSSYNSGITMKTSTWGFQSITGKVRMKPPNCVFIFEQNPLIVLTRESFIKMAKQSLSWHVFQAHPRPNMGLLKRLCLKVRGQAEMTKSFQLFQGG